MVALGATGQGRAAGSRRTAGWAVEVDVVAVRAVALVGADVLRLFRGRAGAEALSR